MARPQQDPQLRITEIIDAAETLFYSKGYHETAISDIVKKMGVAQGTFYYYFKSKDDLLDALINRHLSTLISAIIPVINSNNIIPPKKIESTLQDIFCNIHYKNELLFYFLYNDRTLHLLDKIYRQTKQLLSPLLLKIIDEGNQQNYFHVSQPLPAINLILSIIQSLLDAIYEKSSTELLLCQFKLAVDLIEKALGAQEGTIHINLAL
ncbi:HTH-type transcriptional regulator BetI [Sporomusa silvacetica DSM 10669]|uniref:HTH-type transcriptional regulator BetI n=1 Tax=Sporomusa silvacetica DSM 10669 TaxID=1123289 RepID=A0ABZ3IHE8_9FIRM|nr:TetR/AcrR family transcriptional regulator [Sporomusa silvacetica]OZC13093.1 fatty acid metabolism regulator protein [Sporomusa silvacetica DSM 10669]